MSRRARVERIDRPAPSLLALTLRLDHARHVLVLSVTPRASGAGLVDVRPKGGAIDSIGKKLRDEIEGLEVRGLAVERERFVLHAADGDVERIVVLGRTKAGPYLALYDREGERLAANGPAPDLVDAVALPELDTATLQRGGPALLHAIDGALLDLRRTAAIAATKRALTKLDRRLVAVAADAARVDDVDASRADANALLGLASTLPRGARSAGVLDVTADPPLEREITLDPARSLREQIEALFHRARRLERGAMLAKEREAATRRERDAIAELAGELERATDLETIDRIAASLGTRGVAIDRAQREPGRAAKPSPRLPFRKYVSKSGHAIWVGRTASDNDELTLRHARPHHLFFHARGVPGSHVLVPLAKNASVDPATRLDAATLAAHFSNARGDTIVEVQLAERRHVRKPRGFEPGKVKVDREKVIALRIEPDRLKRLLATEGHEATT